MEKKFVIPELEIVLFKSDDIITASDSAASPFNGIDQTDA